MQSSAIDLFLYLARNRKQGYDLDHWRVDGRTSVRIMMPIQNKTNKRRIHGEMNKNAVKIT